ncbi:MAG: hypothetical protein AAF772_10165, partial [Acidobacteriota bacterium]
LRYLAVAHFGRGRGRFTHATTPARWAHWIDEDLRHRADRWTEAFDAIVERDPEDGGQAALDDAVTRLRPLLGNAARRALIRGYPDAVDLLQRVPPSATRDGREMPD